MLREIVGFRQDDHGDWIAGLVCLHSQHVRHRPPFQPRPWVETPVGRAERVGTELDCPLCDRAELPDGLRRVRTAGPFTSATLPPGLRRAHRVAPRTWGLLRVLDGEVTITLETVPAIIARLHAGDEQAIPPDVLHAVYLGQPDERCQLEVDFLTGSPTPVTAAATDAAT